MKLLLLTLISILFSNTIIAQKYYQYYPYSTPSFENKSLSELRKKLKIKAETDSVFVFEDGQIPKHGFVSSRHEFDTNGNLVKEWRPDTNIKMYGHRLSPEFLIDSTTYKYDYNNRIINESTFYRTRTDSNVFEYDSLGRLYSIKEYDDSTLFNQIEFLYNHDGKIFKEVWLSDLSSQETGYMYYFDEDGRIVKSFQFWKGGAKKELAFEYCYNNNIITEINYKEKVYRTDKYYYDRKHNLTRFIRNYDNYTMDENYRYDKNGNKTYRKWFKIIYSKFQKVSKVFLETSSKYYNDGLRIESIYTQENNYTQLTKKCYEYYN